MSGRVQPKSEIAPPTSDKEQGKTAASATPKQTPEAGKYSNPCGKGEAYQDSELCAQWTSAVASRDAADWAAKTYNVEVVGAIAVAFSLFFSAWAAILALKAYRSTKRTEVAQTRAYMSAESIALFEGPDDEHAPNYRRMAPFAGIVFKNVGNTPAYELRHWGAVVLCPNEECELPEPKMEESGGPHTSHPGIPLTFAPYMDYCLTPDSIAKIQSAELAVVVYGRVTYRDAFGQRRTTNYRLGHSGRWPPPEGHMLRFSSSGNDSD